MSDPLGRDLPEQFNDGPEEDDEIRYDPDSGPGGPDSEAGQRGELAHQQDEDMDRAFVEIDLGRSIKDAKEFMGPGQLATHITTAIEDDTYLADMIHQMQANLDGRKSKEESLPF